MNQRAIGSIWAKSEQIILADRLLLVLVPEETLLTSQLAEAPLIVRTRLLLLRCAHILGLRVSIHALLLDVTVSVLLKEFANWNPVLNPPVQILAWLTFPARLLQPMHTHFLLSLLIIHLVVEWLNNAFNHVDVRSAILNWSTLHPSAIIRVHIEVLTLVSLSTMVVPLVTTSVLLIHLWKKLIINRLIIN